MGVEYYLCDPAKGECFCFGKGWSDEDGSTDTYGRYRWKPITAPSEALSYVYAHFWFIGGEGAAPDPAYADKFGGRLWRWLQGRDQAQLDVADDCGDDIHCDKEEHDALCAAELYARHFFVTGSRYIED